MPRKRVFEEIAVKENKTFTSIDEIDRALSKFGRRLDELKELDTKFDKGRIDVVRRKMIDTAREVFGASSAEFERYENFDIWSGTIFMNMDERYIESCERQGIKDSILKLQGEIEMLTERKEDFIAATPIGNTDKSDHQGKKGDRAGNQIFIVHGHDDGIKYAVANVIHQVGLNPIILHEQPNNGRTIFEKLEDHSDTDFAIVLLTPDDVGHAKGSPDNARPRARQNVILELGYFMGKLTRGRVCALYGEGVELPSDFQGIVYIPLDNHGAWKHKLGGELGAAGFKIDVGRIKN